METSCIRQTELPNTTKLFSDFLYHPDRVKEWYPYLPVSEHSLRQTAEAIHFSDEQRRDLVNTLAVQNAGNPLLQKLAQPGTVAVVTGQQVGLFLGPPYTVYKALTAIRLASQLCENGISAVPVFWLATEDHDLAEVNQSWVWNGEHQPVRLEAGANPAPNQPVGGVVLDSVPLEELRTALSPFPYGEEAFRIVCECYRPGVTFGEAFGALLDRIMGSLPILRVDPMLPEFRALAAPLLRRAVEDAPQLTDELLHCNRELTDRGYHAQVHIEKDTSLFFLLEGGQRIALRRENGTYVAAGKQRFTADLLADRVQDLSPNALLRPVVQDSMIPTVAYVGGPAELAYLAQSEVLYRNLLGRQPVAVNRSGFTLVDARAQKLLARYRLSLPDFFHGEESLRLKAARALVDPQLMGRIADARANAVMSLGRMASDLERFDRSLTKALEKSWRKIEYQFDRIARKVERETITRDERSSHDVKVLMGTLFPRHRLQERLYSSVAFVAQYGTDFAARVYDHVTLDCPDHQLLTLS